MKRDLTPAEYALRALCVWRISDKRKKGAKDLPAGLEKAAIGSKHHRNEQALERAADAYMAIHGEPP